MTWSDIHSPALISGWGPGKKSLSAIRCEWWARGGGSQATWHFRHTTKRRWWLSHVTSPKTCQFRDARQGPLHKRGVALCKSPKLPQLTKINLDLAVMLNIVGFDFRNRYLLHECSTYSFASHKIVMANTASILNVCPNLWICFNSVAAPGILC